MKNNTKALIVNVHEKALLFFLLVTLLSFITISFSHNAIAQDDDEEEVVEEFFSPKSPDIKTDTAALDDEYIIGPEDILIISVWKNADLTREVVVRPDGMITLPLIGDVKAWGVTPTQLREVITSKLEAFQRAVVVAVIVKEVNSYRVYILGQVNSPGVYPLKRRTSILQAIALAGGFSEFASVNKMVLIHENQGSNPPAKKMRISFDDIVDIDEESGKNLILEPGDTIFVP